MNGGATWVARRVEVTESSQVAEARRTATNLAERLGFSETETGKVALVATEAATNLLKHAGHGEILIRVCEPNQCLELLALDKGPGMADVALCMTDGYSTAGSPGNGVGAMRRLASHFDVYSLPGKGAALAARFIPGRSRTKVNREPFEVDGICIPMPGEEESGDGWATRLAGNAIVILVVDGLGHGPLAADVAMAAIKTFLADTSDDPVEVLDRVHTALRSGRGAAGAVARIEPGAELRFSGVGNIAAAICSGIDLRHAVSMNGVLGHNARAIREFRYPWAADATLVMHSDGLLTRWDLNAYPGLAFRSTSVIAGVLYRELRRGRDDATVVVARETRTQ